jgi:hypothetical protein
METFQKQICIIVIAIAFSFLAGVALDAIVLSPRPAYLHNQISLLETKIQTITAEHEESTLETVKEITILRNELEGEKTQHGKVEERAVLLQKQLDVLNQNALSSKSQNNQIPRSSIFSRSSSGSSKSDQKAEKKVYKEGETVNVGYTSYAVWGSWWSSRLSNNQFLDERPNALYLFVDLTVRNNDKKARMVPPFKLVDETGAEYEASSNAWSVDGSIGIIESLNPSVSKQGFVVFDVPKERNYRLKLSGGYWSGEDTYVQLNPK